MFNQVLHKLGFAPLAAGLLTWLLASPAASEEAARQFMVSYGGTLCKSNLQDVASKFSLIDTGFDQESCLAQLKAANPNLKVIGYQDTIAAGPGLDGWEEVQACPGCFMRDQYGHRLISSYYRFFLMDVGNRSWQELYAWLIKTNLERHPAFDGVFADDASASIPYQSFHAEIINEGVNVNPDGMTITPQYRVRSLLDPAISVYNDVDHSGSNLFDYVDFAANTIHLKSQHSPGELVYVTYGAADSTFVPSVEVRNAWRNNMGDLLALAKESIPKDKLLIANTGDFIKYLGVTDGVMAEIQTSLLPSFGQWRRYFEGMVEAAKQQKTFLHYQAFSQPGATQADAGLRSKMFYSYATYLLSKGLNSYFAYTPYETRFDYPEWHIDLGEPVGDAFALWEGIKYRGAPVGSNLLSNASFEEGLKDWSLSNQSSFSTVEVAEEVSAKLTGNRALKISASAYGPSAGVYQSKFALEPNTTYTYSGWIKTLALQSAAEEPVRLVFFAGPGFTGEYSSGPISAGDSDWRYLWFSATTGAAPNDPQNPPYAYGGSLSQACGTAWFDDVRLQKGFPLYSRDFEKGRVLLNYTDDSVSVILPPDKLYKDINSGNLIDTAEKPELFFGPRSGVILQDLTPYTINAQATQGGTIEPSGEVNVMHGGSVVFFITPQPGYEISQLLVDGKPVEVGAEYAFNQVRSNRSITAVFAAALPASSSSSASSRSQSACAGSAGQDFSLLDSCGVCAGNGTRYPDGSPCNGCRKSPERSSRAVLQRGLRRQYAFIRTIAERTSMPFRETAKSGNTAGNPANKARLKSREIVRKLQALPQQIYICADSTNCVDTDVSALVSDCRQAAKQLRIFSFQAIAGLPLPGVSKAKFQRQAATLARRSRRAAASLPSIFSVCR